jgi:hypothetical protein
VAGVDRATGRVMWRSRQTDISIGPGGVAVGWNKVFAATRDGMAALNAAGGTHPPEVLALRLPPST